MPGEQPKEEPAGAESIGPPVTLSSDAPESQWAARAWWYLVWLGIQRQARARQMVWIALALMGFTVTVVALITAARGWSLGQRKWVARLPPETSVSFGEPGHRAVLTPYAHPETRGMELTYEQTATDLEWMPLLGAWPRPAQALQLAIGAACRLALDRSGVVRFSNTIVFPVFVSFLLPIWSLSFGTDTLGGEREAGTLVWLLTRPMSRPAIYLAKFAALLPWTLGFNLGGFLLLCLAAGRPGREVFAWYWLSIVCGTVTFCALFHLISASFRRPAIVAIVYSFFLETLLGNMPGYMKRISISFYTKCLMFDSLFRHGGSPPEKPTVYLPVSGLTAALVLVGATTALLLIGIVIFSRAQYQDLT